MKYRDMLLTVRDRVQKMKIIGRTAQETVAAGQPRISTPSGAKGFTKPDAFVSTVYNTL